MIYAVILKIMQWFCTRKPDSIRMQAVGAESAKAVLHNTWQWRKTRNAHIANHCECAMCRCDKDMEVHHLKPWHLYPDLRFEPTNLVTLCQPCHFRFGHQLNWKNENARLNDMLCAIQSIRNQEVAKPPITVVE